MLSALLHRLRFFDNLKVGNTKAIAVWRQDGAGQRATRAVIDASASVASIGVCEAKDRPIAVFA